MMLMFVRLGGWGVPVNLALLWGALSNLQEPAQPHSDLMNVPRSAVELKFHGRVGWKWPWSAEREPTLGAVT